MKLELIFNIVKYCISAVVTAIPLLVALIAQVKKRKAAKTESEKAEATANIRAKAAELIGTVEVAYQGIDAALRQNGQTAGSLKKESVMSKLQAYMIQQGYNSYYTVEDFDEYVEDVVKLTKTVNAR